MVLSRVAASVAVVSVLSVALAGCVTPREPPPGPSVSELENRAASRIDLAWANTGLEGKVDRPSVAMVSATATFDQLAACVDSSGCSNWGIGDGIDGPELSLGGAGEYPEQQQLSFYICFASYPADLTFGEVRLSDAQLDYLYDYYRSWVMPCLAIDDVVPTRVPTREEFTSGEWRGWNPYDYSDLPASVLDYADAIHRCGPIYADLDVVDPFRRGELVSQSSTFTGPR